MPSTPLLAAPDLATVVVITVTPFDAQGAMSLPALERVVERTVGGGISVVVPAGNTSEYYALSAEEWRRSVEVAVSTSAGRARVVPGVGRDLATAVAQAGSAADLGCAAVMVHQPVDPFVSGEGWLEYHRRIAAAVPGLGLVAYVRDARRSVEDVLRLAEVPGVVGIKYALPDPPAVAELAARLDQARVALVCGLAERWAVAFSASGANGFTSGLGGVAPRLSLDLLACLEAGDYAKARELVSLTVDLELLRARDGSAYNVAAIKEALARLGVCERTVRPPASELPEALRGVVESFLAASGARP